MQTFVHYAVALILVFSFVVQLDAVTVNPLAHICPTNKIAPRRKRYDTHPRTFGQFYNLLTPNNSPSSLQEQPQEDLPDDCGDIEDYDENDIGSVTQRPIRRQGYQRNHFKKKGSSHSHRPSQQHLINQHNQYGKPPSSKPTRPPPAGYFGTNSYSPPKPQQPTDYVKPVNEAGTDPQMIYRPGVVVGAPLYQVVGLPQNTPGSRPQPTDEPDSTPPNKREPKYYAHHAYVPATQSHSNANNHHRPRKFNGDTGILGSFVDLFF